MSVSLWAWTEKCDHGFCVGDCDICDRNLEDEEIDDETAS